MCAVAAREGAQVGGFYVERKQSGAEATEGMLRGYGGSCLVIRPICAIETRRSGLWVPLKKHGRVSTPWSTMPLSAKRCLSFCSMIGTSPT